LKRNFSLFLALRYLKPERTPVSIITVICIAGVALGVWVLTTVISVMNGFEARATELLLGYEGHVFIENRPTPHSPPHPFIDWRPIVEKLGDDPEVISLSPVVEGLVLADAHGRRNAFRMRAIQETDPEAAEYQIEKGTHELTTENSALISNHVRDSLGIDIGDNFTLYSQGHLELVTEAFQEAERDPLSKDHAETLQNLLETIDTGVREFPLDDDDLVSLPPETVEQISLTIESMLDEAPRKPGEQRRLVELENFLWMPLGTGPENRYLYEKTALAVHFANIRDIAEAPPETDPEKALEEIKELVFPIELEVVGIYKQPPNVTAVSIIIPLHLGQELYGLSGYDAVHSISIRTPDPYDAQASAARLQQGLPPGLSAIAWMKRPDLERFFYGLANERRMMYFALFCIMVVAAFCIMVTMITITVEKTHEIGVMKALGARESQIVWVFLAQGMVVGFVGALSGLGLGWLTVHFRLQIQKGLSAIGWDPFPADIYDLEEIPALMTLDDIVFISTGAFILCSLAALPPAWMVARLDPAKALRKT